MFKNNVYMNEAGEDGAESGSAGEAVEQEQGLLASGVEKEVEQVEEVAQGRPEFLKEQFWDSEKNEPRLESLAKSQSDFEKQARVKTGNVPANAEDYQLNISEDLKAQGVEDDPDFGKFKELALKNNVTQEAFDGFMQGIIELSLEAQPDRLNLADEKAKLGDRADSIIEAVNVWADRLVDVGLFNDNERAAIETLGSTADGIKALNKIRQHYTKSPEIPTRVSTEDGAMSESEYYAAVGSDRYAQDVDYRNKVKEHSRRIFGTDPSGSSKSGLGL